MGSDATRQQGAYVGQLADHARQLQREARRAIARGDYAQAAALIGDAELLAGDVHDLVDDIEQHQTGAILNLAAQAQAQAESAALRRRDTRHPLSRSRVRMALGTSIAMSLALVEC